MPQMSPLLWTNLFVFFTLMFFLIMILNFFIKPPIKISSHTTSIDGDKPIWKW